jgi:hypothetical protein
MMTSLNGTWELEGTNDTARPDRWTRTVPVPALVDVAAPPYDWKESKFHWYRKIFKNDHKTDHAHVRLDQAMFGTEVWLNDVHLGGDIACYTSQEYDVAGVLRTGLNELIIRIGQRSDLPPHSAVGNDQERSVWIPGIWGDVALIQCGNPFVTSVQTIPHIATREAEVRVRLRNHFREEITCIVESVLVEHASGRRVGESRSTEISIAAEMQKVVTIIHRFDELRLWSVDDPFLYQVETDIRCGGKTVDSIRTAFGMREFRIDGSDFLLNGKKIFLRGGNIAFHRFLSDPDRGTLPWNAEWIERVLIDIPKAHHFNFFRNHIGQMYNKWYDIADEKGMLLQNEWMFWRASGSKEQIRREFTRWLEDNWNHPSIIIWDPLNESTDETVQRDIVPEMKLLDPTRPWESVDVTEEHPYIYSLGPVMNERKFGFARGLEEIAHSSAPATLNEFCWWWLDSENNPSPLMEGVVERWLGPGWTREELVRHQSFLIDELVGLFRRMRVAAIQPFVYLSNNTGPTAHWFLGDIADAWPKPVLAALKNAFEPFGISIELWDRHFLAGEHRTVHVHVLNDEPRTRTGVVRYGILDANGDWVSGDRCEVAVDPSGSRVLPLDLRFPAGAGEYRLRAELYEEDLLRASSEKQLWVCDPVVPPDALRGKAIGSISPREELSRWLATIGIRLDTAAHGSLGSYDLLVVGEGGIHTEEYRKLLPDLTEFVRAGKTLVVLEPEYGVTSSCKVDLIDGRGLTIKPRDDREKGGYDSYVFADDRNHPLWNGISKEHLKMFNGGYGGEIVSEHDVVPDGDAIVHARAGLNLKHGVVLELRAGRGRILISRIQVRGRLLDSPEAGERYARRTDPVARQFICNLVSYAAAS